MLYELSPALKQISIDTRQISNNRNSNRRSLLESRVGPLCELSSARYVDFSSATPFIRAELCMHLPMSGQYHVRMTKLSIVTFASINHTSRDGSTGNLSSTPIRLMHYSADSDLAPELKFILYLPAMLGGR